MKPLFVLLPVLLSLLFLQRSNATETDLTIMAPEEPPLGFTDSNGEFTGVTVDVLKEIQRRVGNTNIIQVTPWSRAYHDALRYPNIVLFTAARTEEREDKFHWITPINHNAWAFLATKETHYQLNTLEDAKLVDSIGVMRGAAHERYLLEHGFPRSIIQGVTDFDQNVKKLRIGRIDLLFYSVIGLAISSKLIGVDFHEFRSVLHVNPPKAYIVMSKGTDLHIVRRWQAAAQEIKDDGTFYRIATDWSQSIEKELGLRSHVKGGVLNLWQEPES